jgi:MoxR-like ATPase
MPVAVREVTRSTARMVAMSSDGAGLAHRLQMLAESRVGGAYNERGVQMTQDARVQEFVTAFEGLRAEVEKVIVGHREIINHVLVGMFAGGHVLLEGVPGLGKTLLVKTLSESLELSFARIQFTPDLMPADIIGTNIIVEDAEGRKHFQFQPGPIFAHVVLADEINRATPKTQSALLEGMQEASVTVGGASRPLPAPFFVLATQNPIEMEGTYPLPEAQLDRFLLKLRVRYPAIEELNAIIDRTTHARPINVERVMSGDKVLAFRELIREVPVASHVRDFASGIVMATHPQWADAPEITRRFVRYGASPRGAQALVLGAKVRALAEGRYNVSVEDLKTLAAPALRHRVILNFEGEAEGVDVDNLVAQIIEGVEATTARAKEPFLR